MRFPHVRTLGQEGRQSKSCSIIWTRPKRRLEKHGCFRKKCDHIKVITTVIHRLEEPIILIQFMIRGYLLLFLLLPWWYITTKKIKEFIFLSSCNKYGIYLVIGQQYQTALSIASVQPRMELLLQKKKIRKYLKDECCYCFFFSVLFRSKKVDVHKQNFNTKQRKKRWLLKEDMCSSFMMFYCGFFFLVDFKYWYLY